MIDPFLTTLWDQTDGFKNHNHCISTMYLRSCLGIQFYISIERSVGAPRHVKDVVDVFNSRYKWRLKSAMAKLLNPKLI